MREKKTANVFLDQAGFKEMKRYRIGSNAWWERLSDFTEIPPEWLRGNVDISTIMFATRGDRECGEVEFPPY